MTILSLKGLSFPLPFWARYAMAGGLNMTGLGRPKTDFPNLLFYPTGWAAFRGHAFISKVSTANLHTRGPNKLIGYGDIADPAI
jgi:hypothetical protein